MPKRLVVLLSLACSGCGEGAAEEAVAAQFPDPASARFQNVRSRDGHVCGEVNGASASGARTGYRRFVYDRAEDAAMLDPQVLRGEAEVAAFERTCGETGPMGTAFNSGNCQWAAEARAALQRQQSFDALWKRECT